jgi:ankyrin repeat protein
LHEAVGAGDLDAVRLLLDAGADAQLRDATFHSTPAEWANWFRQPEIAAYLRDAERRSDMASGKPNLMRSATAMFAPSAARAAVSRERRADRRDGAWGR